MNIHKKHILMGFLASVMLILLFSSISAASINIDTFDVTTQTVSADPITTLDTDFATGSEMIGGERDLIIQYFPSALDSVTASVNRFGNQYLSISNNSGVNSRIEIQWDGIDGDIALNRTGLHSLPLAERDFTDGGTNDGIELAIIQTDGQFTLTIIVYSAADEASEIVLNVNQTIPAPGRSFFFPFNDFVLSGAPGITSMVDWTDVGAVQFIIDANDSVDLRSDLLQANSITDWGDLPASYSATTSTDNGARHIAGSLNLGPDFDTEVNGFESPDADGDDTDNRPDEDGIVVLPGTWGDGDGEIQYTVHGNGTTDACLLGWIDWDGTGGFSGFAGGAPKLVLNAAVPAASMGIPVTATITTPDINFGDGYVYPTPPDAVYARFRLFPANDPLFAASGVSVNVTTGCPQGSQAVIEALIHGEGANGEVEDYAFTFSNPTAVNLQTFSADNNATTLPVVGIAIVAVLALVSAGIFIVRREQKQA